MPGRAQCHVCQIRTRSNALDYHIATEVSILKDLEPADQPTRSGWMLKRRAGAARETLVICSQRDCRSRAPIFLPDRVRGVFRLKQRIVYPLRVTERFVSKS